MENNSVTKRELAILSSIYTNTKVYTASNGKNYLPVNTPKKEFENIAATTALIPINESLDENETRLHLKLNLQKVFVKHDLEVANKKGGPEKKIATFMQKTFGDDSHAVKVEKSVDEILTDLENTIAEFVAAKQPKAKAKASDKGITQ
jgi:hypothetical protein